MKIPRRYVCHALAAGFCALFVVPTVLMHQDVTPPIEIHRSVMVPNQVRPGDTVQLVWTATELRACDGSIRRRFVDSAGVIFETVPAPTIYRDVLGSNKTFSREVRIPMGMAPGPAIFTGTRRYWCNPLQRMFEGQLGFEIVLPAPIIRFTVLEPLKP